MKNEITEIKDLNLFNNVFIDIKFDHQVAIISGKNGCGKSALLSSINDINVKYLMLPTFHSSEGFRCSIYDCFQPDNKEYRKIVEKYIPDIKKKSINPVSAFSSGQAAILRVLHFVYINRHKAKIILIDEIENSLCIEWQRGILNDLVALAPDVQFIVSSHSPAIIMNGWLDHIYCIEDYTYE